jgi:hypothetical protein
VLSFVLTDPTFAKSLVAKIVLSTVPEMVGALIFIVAGLATRNMWKGLSGKRARVSSI